MGRMFYDNVRMRIAEQYVRLFSLLGLTGLLLAPSHICPGVSRNSSYPHSSSQQQVNGMLLIDVLCNTVKNTRLFSSIGVPQLLIVY